ncbi:MAG: hypothetical protein AAGK97_04630 [Bacteroidota bacterium]
MKKLIIIMGFIFSTASIQLLNAGGPWPLQRGKAYLKISEYWIVFDQHYTDVGVIDPNVTTGIFNTMLYGEYGLTDRFTIGINGALFSRNYMNNLVSGTTGEILVQGEALNSVGDIDLFLKYGLTKPGSRIPVAVTALFGLPLGKEAGGTQGNLQTGDGEFNQLLQLDVGTSFRIGKNINAYTSAYIGFNNRTNGFSDEIRFGAEIGANVIKDKLWLIGRLAAIESMKNGAVASEVTSTSIFANNTEFISIGLEANYYLTDKVGLSAGVAGATRGEIIAARPSYTFGVFIDLSK